MHKGVISMHKGVISMSECWKLTMFLSHLQKHRLPQDYGEGLVLLVLLVINDLHIQQLPTDRQTDRQVDRQTDRQRDR